MIREKVLNMYMMRCSRAEYCTGTIEKSLNRLVAKGELQRSDAEFIIDVLQKQGFLDDSRFAAAYVRDKNRIYGWGRVKIAYKLKSMALPDTIIERAIEEEFDNDEGAKRLAILLENKYRSLKNNESSSQKRAKCIRYALSRGFEYEMACKLFDSVIMTNFASNKDEI